MPRCSWPISFLDRADRKCSKQYEYGNPTKDYGFKRWYPEQGMTAEQIDTLEGKWRNTMRDMTQKVFLNFLTTARHVRATEASIELTIRPAGKRGNSGLLRHGVEKLEFPFSRH